MQWTADLHGGFSTAEQTALPVVGDRPVGYHRVNVAEQRRDPGSLLHGTERLIRLRKACQACSWGEAQLVRTGSPHILAIATTWRQNTGGAVHPCAPRPAR